VQPFVLLATRAEDVPADEEYELLLRYTGLEERMLRRIRLEAAPMPPLNLDAISGIIVGGGPFNTSDPVDLKSETQRRVEHEMAALLDEVVDRDFPFLGACYGVGTLGVHQGAIVDRTYSEAISVVSVTLTDDGAADPLFAGMPRTFGAFVGHKEAVRTLPPHLVRLAGSPGCPVQAFRSGANVYATQFHPELDVEGISVRIRAYADYGYFADGELDLTLSAVRAAPVTEPARLLRTFVERYAR
jgi:GMP synthase (glutamine-hydrolysing)